MVEQYQIKLKKAITELQIADHMALVTYPLIKDKRVLLKSFEKLYSSIINLISAILQYEYLWKRIKIYQDPKDNLKTFLDKLSPKYNVSKQDLNEIKEMILIFEEHKKSPIEFTKGEKIIIMSKDLKTRTLDLNKIKIQINLIKDLIKKFNEKAYQGV